MKWESELSDLGIRWERIDDSTVQLLRWSRESDGQEPPLDMGNLPYLMRARVSLSALERDVQAAVENAVFE